MKNWQIDFINDWCRPWGSFCFIELSFENIFGKELYVRFLGLGFTITYFTDEDIETINALADEARETIEA